MDWTWRKNSKKLPFNQTFEYLTIPIKDATTEDFSQYFDKSNDFIRSNLENGSVLVHCHAGVSRSATAILAFLIGVRGYSLESALELLRSKRNKVKPNDAFMKQLQEYESSQKEKVP